MAERTGFYEEILISEEYGAVEGYAVSVDKENIANFLSKNIPDERACTAIVDWLRANRGVVAVLANIHVAEPLRGKGLGTKLMGQFFDAVNDAGADTILLISDVYASLAEGFDLEKWSEGFDFEVLARFDSGDLMVYPIDTAEALREAIVQNRAEPVSN